MKVLTDFGHEMALRSGPYMEGFLFLAAMISFCSTSATVPSDGFRAFWCAWASIPL